MLYLCMAVALLGVVPRCSVEERPRTIKCLDAGQPEVMSAEQDAVERRRARGVGPRRPEHGPQTGITYISGCVGQRCSAQP